MTLIFEAYADEEAFAAHHHGHMKELEARFAHLVDPSSFWLSVLKRVGGFVRPLAQPVETKR